MGPVDIRTAMLAHGLELPDFEEPGGVPSTQRKCIGCDATVLRSAPLGCCSKCLVAEVERQREDVLTRALPEIHLPARFGPGLSAWCKDMTAIRWSEAFGRKCPPCPTLTLWGTTGSGKSTLAAATLRALLAGPRRHATIAWVDARDLAIARREHKLGRGEPPEIEAAIDADITVIDELGKETLSRDGNPADVVRVIDERHRRRGGRLTIITTEWSATDGARGAKLADIYMPSLVRRLTEDWRPGPPPVGSAIVIHVRRHDELQVAA